jgi:multiple sugar transport system permease protein
MAVILLYFAVPLLWLILSTTKDQSDLFSTSGFWVGHRFALWDNLEKVFAYNNGIYGRWLLNTVLYAVASAVGAAIVSALGGYALARFSFPGKRAMFSVILGAVMIPGSVLAIPIFFFASKLGLGNNPIAVIVPSLASPFGLYLMSVYVDRSVPVELIEAGRVDGASEFRIFVSIVSRLLMPGLVSVTLLQLTGAWNAYFLPLVLLNSSSRFPLGVGLVNLNSAATQMGSATLAQGVYPIVLTGSLIAVIQLICAFLILQRYWQAGLATGGVKL